MNTKLDPLQVQKIRMLDRFYGLFIRFCFGLLVIGVPFVFYRKLISAVLIVLVCAGIWMARRLSRRGNPEHSLILFSIGLWIVLVGLLYGGLPPNGAGIALATCVMLAVVVNNRAAIIYFSSYLLMWLIYITLQHYQLAPPPYFSNVPLVAWVLVVGAFWLILIPIPEMVRALNEGTSLQRSVLEATSDGILVVNLRGVVDSYNQRFVSIWGIPTELIDEKSDAELLNYVVSQIPNPQEFVRRVTELYQHPEQSSFDTLTLKDHRVIERFSHPNCINGKVVGRVWSFRDVTESNTARQELQSSQGKLQALFELSPLGMTRNGMDGHFYEVNPALTRMLGYSIEELKSMSYWDITPQDYADQDAIQLDNLRLKGSYGPYEKEYIHKDGHKFPVRLNGILIQGGQGDSYIWSIIEDITDRRQLEEKMRSNTELVNTVLENLPCGFSVFDSDLKLISVNAEFGRMLEFPEHLTRVGVTRFEDVIRFNGSRAEYGTENVEAIVQGIIERAKQPIVAHLFERSRPDGKTLEVRGGPMPSGGFITTYTDITTRKQAEAEGKRASELLRNAIEALDDAFSLFDADDRLVICNQRYKELYPLCADLMEPGVTFEQIIRGGAERGQYEAVNGRVDEWVQARLDTHRQPSSQLKQKLTDGRTLRISEHKMPDGQTVGFRVDITELVRATEAAQEASRSKSQFLANMSHEIRTPMNAILGMLALLQNTELNARQLDYANKSEGAAKSLLGLLNDILDFSKVEAGKMTLDPQPFRIDRLMRDLSVILSAYVGTKDIEVLFDMDPRIPPVIMGDSMRLQQVLINLGGNAIKFTSAGQVVIALRLHGTAAQHAGKYVAIEFAVKDSGIGIARENQSHIFDGFSQAEASTTRRFGGTGLGLAISKRLVEIMGGKLQLSSEMGVGSTFAFTLNLPVVQDIPEQLAIEPRPNTDAKTVLVVDDNDVARDLISQMTRAWGWETDVAASGYQALEMFHARAARQAKPYQVVYLDWHMPGMDGWETAEKIRQIDMETGAQRPLLMMVTAHGRETLSQRTQEEQDMLNGFLVKPVTPSMLYDAVVDSVRSSSQLRSGPRVGASKRRLNGMRLLVVEDNQINQQVAEELLISEGALVSLAANGQLGIDAVAAATPQFDAVLMDIQMPIMDGYAATRFIRDQLGLVDLPIVAMTANAMASDREDCLTAGMNEHVGKPFDLQQLVNTLLRLTGHQIGANSRAMVAPDNPSDAISETEVQGIDVEGALARMSGLKTLYLRSARDFLKYLPTAITEFQQLAQDDMDKAGMQMHTLKGTAAILGATALSNVASQLEKLCNVHPEFVELQNKFTTLDSIVRTTTQALVQVIEELDLSDEATSSKQTKHLLQSAPLSMQEAAILRAHLEELDAFLVASDLTALDKFSQIRNALGSLEDSVLTPLEDALQELELEDAHRLCRNIIASLIDTHG